MKNKKSTGKLIDYLNKTFDFLLNSPYSTFYKDKYIKAGVKIKSIKNLEQFESLPYLTKDEILSVNPNDFVFVPPKSINNNIISSGTTNQKKPLILLVDRFKKATKWDEFEKWKPFLDLNINKHLLLLPAGAAVSRTRAYYGAERMGIFNVFGDINNFPSTALLIKRIGIESIDTTSSILNIFIPHLKKELDLNKIKIIILSGEYTSEQKYKYFQKIFKKAKFFFEFGMAETGCVAASCEYLTKRAPRFLHPHDFFHLEVIGKDQEGELVVTELKTRKEKAPLMLRYKTGMQVRLSNEVCPCKKTKVLEVIGKIGYEFINVMGTSIYAVHIYNLLSPFSKFLLTTDFKLHVYEVIKKDKLMTRLVLQLILDKRVKDQSVLKEKIKEELEGKLFLTAKNTLKDLVDKEIFLPLEVEFVDTFPLASVKTPIISHII